MLNFRNMRGCKFGKIIIIMILTFGTLIYLKYNINRSKDDDAKELGERIYDEDALIKEILTSMIQYKNSSNNQMYNIPEPVLVTKTTIPTPKPTEVAPVNSPWLEYRANWNGQDLLLDINDETGLLTLLPEYRPRMLSKLHHPLTEVYLPFKERFDIMNKYCDELKIPSTQSMMLYDDARMYFNDSYESIYCDVPKASSRVWVRKYAQMHNITRQWDPEPPPGERKIFSVGYHMIPHSMTAKRIQTYTKTLVTRHPFNRLISGFNDKFSNHPLYVDGLSKEIIKKLYLTDLPANESVFISLINTKYSYMNTDNKMNILFQYMRLENSHLKLITLMEFLLYLIVTWEEEGNALSFDPHWRPITEHCLPCSFTYDILIEHDKIAEESQMVLDYLQKKNNLHSIEKFNSFDPQTSANVCNKAFKEVPISIRKQIFEIYKHDFALFGYKSNLTSHQDICQVL